jgi:hypothetical protein
VRQAIWKQREGRGVGDEELVDAPLEVLQILKHLQRSALYESY